MQSEIAANHLRFLLQKQGPPYDYKKLRNDPKIRKIATQPIYVPGYEKKRIAGNMDLIDNKGLAVIHPNKMIEGENYQKWEKEYPQMWKYVQDSFTEPKVSGYYTFINKEGEPEKKYMALTQIKDTPFIVCAFVEINHYFVPIHKIITEYGDRHKALVDKKMEITSQKNFQDLKIKGVIGSIILVIIGVFLAIWQAENIANPIQVLCQKVTEIGKGNFTLSVPEKGTREIASLAASFNALGGRLTKYMDNLKREISARQAMESEIAITRRIQESLLPHSFPPFPDNKEFDLHASLIPAKDVSGDFYDFFFVDKETLVLIIADVSGKGLPASLFMAVTRTLLRNLCMNTSENTPGRILEKANEYLCQDNDACMFVTTFLAFYNIGTGTMTYANAGHNELISKKKNSNCNSFGGFTNLPLGVQENHKFKQNKYSLEINETIVFYTDGATEAVNKKNEQYGIKRFEKQIQSKNSSASIVQLIEDINKDLQEFQGDKQFDDITIMMLKRNT